MSGKSKDSKRKAVFKMKAWNEYLVTMSLGGILWRRGKFQILFLEGVSRFGSQILQI